MIETLAGLITAAGHEWLPAQRWANAPSEKAIHESFGVMPTETGIAVSESNALSYIPVLACTRIISETLAVVPLKVYRDSDDGPEVAKNHYLYPILHDQPNPEMTHFNFWEAMGVQLCLYNNAYAEIEWNNAGRVRALWPLLPDRVSMRRIAGKLVYDYQSESGLVTLPSENVLHIPGCLGVSGVVAESMIKYAREAIGLGLAPQKYAANFYRQNARPGVYLEAPQALGKDTREALRAAWNDVHAGLQGAGRTAVLEGGVQLKTLGVSQKDAEFSATREHQLLEACRMYRMPPHMVAELSRATNSNIENQDIGFTKHTMSPYYVRCQEVINSKLIGIGSGYYAEFVVDGLMRGDFKTRVEGYATMIQNAMMMPDEARSKENLPRVKGGNKLYIQGATIPLEMAGKHLESASEPEKSAA